MEQNIKSHLVDLLFEYYKFNCFLDNIRDAGLEAAQLEIAIYNVVLDMIGFPKEPPVRRGLMYDQDDDSFARDWLDEELFSLFNSLRELHLFASATGFQPDLKLSRDQLAARDVTVKSYLAKHIDWLYNELQELRKVRPDLFQ